MARAMVSTDSGNCSCSSVRRLLRFLIASQVLAYAIQVLCVALADPTYNHVDALRQVSPHKLREIEHFFETYKNLEDKSVETDGWAGVAETLELLRQDRDRWLVEQQEKASREAAAQGRGEAGS